MGKSRKTRCDVGSGRPPSSPPKIMAWITQKRAGLISLALGTLTMSGCIEQMKEVARFPKADPTCNSHLQGADHYSEGDPNLPHQFQLSESCRKSTKLTLEYPYTTLESSVSKNEAESEKCPEDLRSTLFESSPSAGELSYAQKIEACQTESKE